MLQQGYAFGYLLATAFARGLVGTTSHGWRPLYWFGACPPILIIAFRLCLPETNAYRQRQAQRQAKGPGVAGTFLKEGKVALRNHWMVLIYLVCLMAGFNFVSRHFCGLVYRLLHSENEAANILLHQMSHGSQDLYPTMLKNQYNFSESPFSGNGTLPKAQVH